PTGDETWIAPPDRADYIPVSAEYALDINGAADLRTVYLAQRAAQGLRAAPPELEISPLLRALILALSEELVLYDESGRGGAIARLIVSEIARARRLPLVIPMPRDPRLRRVCIAILAAPESPHRLDDWATGAGASSRTLARLFQQEVGLSFSAWRRRVRFHNALEALVR